MHSMTQPAFDPVASHRVPDIFGNKQTEAWWARWAGCPYQYDATNLLPFAFFQNP